MSKGIKNIFFDFDGVLADSVEVKTKAFAKLFEPYGPEIVAKVVDHHQKHGGMTRVDKFYHYYQEFLGMQLDDNELNSLCHRFAELVVDGVIAAPEIPGVTSFLELCDKKGILCFVVSATPEKEINDIVEKRGWKKYFQEVCGAPTSKKQNLRKLIKKYCILPEYCLYFGDVVTDYRAAQACKIPFIGIAHGKEAALIQTSQNIQLYKNFSGMDKKVGLNSEKS